MCQNYFYLIDMKCKYYEKCFTSFWNNSGRQQAVKMQKQILADHNADNQWK